MSDQLLVFLEAKPEQPITWVIRNTESRQLNRHGLLDGANQLSTLKEIAPSIPCYVIVPASAVMQLRVKLPVNSREARDSIPYQLEDQLCEDVEALHFSLGPIGNDNDYPVAVVSKHQMTMWHQWLDAADIQPQALIAESLQQQNDASLTALAWKDRVIVQEQPFRSISVDTASFECWKEIAAKQLNKPLSIISTVGNALDTHNGNSEASSVALTATKQSEDQISAAQYFAVTPAINLLQGDFRFGSTLQQSFKLWLWPAALTLLLILTFPAKVYWQNLQLQQQKEDITEQTHQLYRRAFPDSTRIVNVRSQTEQRLKKLRKVSKGDPVLVVLNQLLPALKKYPEIQIQGLDFAANNQQFRLRISAPQSSSLNSFGQTLIEQGFSSEVKTLRRQSTYTEGIVTLQGAN